jgi:predicted secreted hydrolase
MKTLPGRIFCPAVLWTAIILWSACVASTAAEAPGFKRITGPCRLSFPADHGPHPRFRTEWWYYTGNLSTSKGRRFGFQLTFFRSGLRPPGERKNWPAPASAWRSDQVYLAHAAVSDIKGERHRQAEQMARPVLSLAGAEQRGAGWTIHLNDWRAVIAPQGHHLEADTEAFALHLDLKPQKPVVLHGQAGYSRKGTTAERASCYYSFTRLGTTGVLTVDGIDHEVRGTAWMDHEFSSAPLEPGIAGWDWFGLQLSDRTEVMLYLLRRSDGSLHPASSATFVAAAGKVRHLTLKALRVQPLAHWSSPHSGGRYPTRWRINLVPLGLILEVDASLADQEMHTPRSTGVDYWEGSVRVKGTRDGQPVSGVGYMELTGYAKPFDAPM